MENKKTVTMSMGEYLDLIQEPMNFIFSLADSGLVVLFFNNVQMSQEEFHKTVNIYEPVSFSVKDYFDVHYRTIKIQVKIYQKSE